jgi:hypothetical protein
LVDKIGFRQRHRCRDVSLTLLGFRQLFLCREARGRRSVPAATTLAGKV